MCITFVRQTASTDISKYTSWGCASISTIFEVFAQVTNGANISASDSAFSSGPTAGTSAGGGGTNISASSTSSGTTTTNTISRPAEIGAIVGAICGALVLLVLGAFMARRLSRHRRAKLSDPTQAELDNLKAEEVTQEVGGEEVRPELEEVGRVHELAGGDGEERNRQELRGHEFSQELEVPRGRTH
ncbi:hypothetical protein MMC17_002298 [Xylographa soralifera]|nr:hypothetical protein [Xylographa soralifera]